MASLWGIAKALHIPLTPKIKNIHDIPYTISYVIRKRQQIDGLNEIPRDKRPPEFYIWDKPSEELDKWIDRVYLNKKEKQEVEISIEDIEQ